MAAAGETALPQERELARQYGVSVKTVRRALAHLKRARVLRSVPGKGTFVVPPEARKRLTLVLVRSLAHPAGAIAAQVATEALREHGMPSTVLMTGENAPEWSAIGLAPDELRNALLIGGGMHEAWLDMLRRAGVPTALLGDLGHAVRHPPPCHQVVPDSRAASFLATRHLLRAGHHRVLLSCWGGDLAWGRDLIRGYREALEEAGLPFDPALTFSPPTVHFDPGAAHYIESLGAAQQALDRLLELPDAPTAVVHNAALQAQAQAMRHDYFHDRFAESATVVITHREQLEASYRDADDTWAVAMPYRQLVDWALALLDDARKDAAPTRIMVDRYGVWRRSAGRWQLYDAAEPGEAKIGATARIEREHS